MNLHYSTEYAYVLILVMQRLAAQVLDSCFEFLFCIVVVQKSQNLRAPPSA